MGFILYQDFGSNVNFLQEINAASKQEAVSIAQGETQYLNDQGFPGTVRVCSPATWESIEGKSEVLNYKKLCQQYGKDNVVSPAKVRAQMSS